MTRRAAWDTARGAIHADAFHLMGGLSMEAGDPHTALQWIDKAIAFVDTLPPK